MSVTAALAAIRADVEARRQTRAEPALWRLERRAALRVLTDDDVVVDDEARARAPDCPSCTERCCAVPEGVVSVRLDDAARLLDAGQGGALVAPEDLLARFPRIAATLGSLVERETFMRSFVLDKRADGACVFLDEGRCAIHALRPLQCRAFPLQVEETRTRVRWASSCRAWVPAPPAAPGGGDALASYNAKVGDLVVRALAEDALRGLGLIP